MQGQEPKVAVAPPNVQFQIQPLQNPIPLGGNVSLKMTIVNQSSDWLALNFVPDLATFWIEARDSSGKPLAETEEGCRRRQSPQCANGPHNGTMGSMLDLYVPPKESRSANINVSLEFVIDHAGTYTVDVYVDGFHAISAPAQTNFFDLGAYPHRELGRLKSNSVTFQIVPR
jgi:hypothetical protein